jgi:hypothetical protein
MELNANNSGTRPFAHMDLFHSLTHAAASLEG